MNCFFCDINFNTDPNILATNESFFARLDDFPISPGHMEIIPKKHFASIFEIDQTEFQNFFQLLTSAKKILDDQFHPDGYNIGINQGIVAGQSISHLHVHLILRYAGDVENPRGGVRNILRKGDYTNDAKKMGREHYLES